jgi:hypothetical protein
MKFHKFTNINPQYPLDHLDSYTIIVPAKDPLQAPAVLRVTYGHHVFTEKWDTKKHDASLQYFYANEKRAFCPVRYVCSLSLKEIIQYHIGGKAYLTRDGKGHWNHLFYAEIDGVSYPVFFELENANKINGIEGILHIKSAYQKPDLPKRNKLQSVKFARLVHQISAIKK